MSKTRMTRMTLDRTVAAAAVALAAAAVGCAEPRTILAIHTEAAPFHQSTAALVAVQDGDAPWTVVPADSSTMGVYQVELESSRFGVLAVCEYWRGWTQVRLFQLTTEEATAVHARCLEPTERVRVAVTVDVPPGKAVGVSLGPEAQSVIDGEAVFEVFPGPWDVVVEQVPFAGGPTERTLVRRRMEIWQDTTMAVDIETDGVVAEPAPVEVHGLAADDSPDIGGHLLTSAGTFVPFSGNNTPPYFVGVLPVMEREPNDMFAIHARTYDGTVLRHAARYTSDASAVSVGLPRGMGAVDATVVTAAPLSVELSWETQDGAQLYMWTLGQSGEEPSSYRWWDVVVSPGWLEETPAAAGTSRYRVPSSALLDWLPREWSFAEGVPVYWSGGAESSSGGVDALLGRHQFFVPPSFDGVHIAWTWRFGMLSTGGDGADPPSAPH